MKIKRVLAFTAALTLMFSAYCQPVFAEGSPTIVSSGTTEDIDDPEKEINWSLDDKGTLTISGNGAPYYSDWLRETDQTAIKSVVVEPGITAFQTHVFASCTELTSVQLPDTLTSISYGAFSLCLGLTDLTVPDSVTSIEDKAFEFCENLKNVTIGSSVETIGKDVFDACASLSTITFKNPKCQIPESATFDVNLLTIRGYKGSTAEELAKEHYQKFEAIDSDYTADYTDFSKKSTIGGKTDNDLLWEITNNFLTITGEKSADGVIKDAPWLAAKDYFDTLSLFHITSISEGAFRGCSNLKGMSSSDELTSIGAMAFADCPKLEYADLSDSLTSIGADAFKNCTSLTEVYIKEKTEKIDKTAFENCSPDLCINGYSGSYAEQFAKENNIKFDPIDIINSVSYIKGDANCDKTVDMSDAVLIMQSLSNPSKYKLTEQGRENADFDGDGVTNGDALTIQKKLLKLD
ncbi:MAG: leucine-rich repeat protein [Ruminococcus flavefaciens]